MAKGSVKPKQMTADERRALKELCDRASDDFDDSTALYHSFSAEDVLDGSEAIDISHGGGKFKELTKELMGDFWHLQSLKPQARRTDYRTRRDRVQRRIDAFNRQMPSCTDGYMQWSVERGEEFRGFFEERRRRDGLPGPDVNSGSISIKVVDLFSAEKVSLIILPTDDFITSALVRQGVVPCSPISPVVGITIDALEFYRVARQRNPHYSIQSFVKTICDLHSVQFQRYLSRQFSIALDLYLQIRSSVDLLVLEAIRHDSKDWRLRHACPACTYTLSGEAHLKFKMLYAMDGNDSLKRVQRKLAGEYEDDDLDSPPASIKLPSSQQVAGDRYLSREFVDQFANDVPHDMFDDAKDDGDNPCASRWKNMKDEGTKKMWGVFDESGVFLAVCRHGFSLVIADMVQSGERAKYPLAVVSKLLDAFGEDLGGGYDIGCKFKTTLSKSSLGPRARALNHTSLVPAFHGHAHRRLCQLLFLAIYVLGLGLEDLEGCERTFSKSNALASAVRYASIFHRRQAIALYFEHNDDYEIYQNLTNFLYNNYKQALDILHDGQATLSEAMRELKVTSETVFESWLAEEKAYLMNLRYEPVEETLQMEYWQKLINLEASRKDLDAVGSTWNVVSSAAAYDQDARTTNYENNLNIVQSLEIKLGVAHRWVPGDPEWQNAGRLVANRKYQRALDTLEGLIVARLFELTKMNRAGTGYKMRKHIGKALQARSAAIRTALDRYNTAARALSPPRRELEWDEVVEYVFLADFDLLRDARQDVSHHPWATPAGRSAMDLYFKMLRAKEEIQRLNVEVRRLVTYLRDEDHYLHACESQLREQHPALAHQIGIRHRIRSRFTAHHLRRLNDIAALPGFSGTLVCGESTQCGPGESASTPHARVPARMVLDTPLSQWGGPGTQPESTEDLEEEEDDDEEAEERSRALQDLLHVSADS
ncbi:hypothetical protein BV22DRAFT_1105986 [Leucogyrophana mollusca]|uniref:Uncharacterized protein n=1 Tax=Leucogyrophana mollusca TaxID=85980 RepID=A0ACB8BDT4_9AGAM|nr:hypothetical protein BV22DRAFT_1105986 [Leucogyrophana mollusca]